MNALSGYLLDANVVSEMMRPAPEPKVAAFLDRAARKGIGIASITVWEILNGIGRLEFGRRRHDLGARFQGILDEVFSGRVLDWTVADARACANVMEERRRRGESSDHHLPDAMLAGTALSRGLTIATRNEKEFRNTGIAVMNPWARPAPKQLS